MVKPMDCRCGKQPRIIVRGHGKKMRMWVTCDNLLFTCYPGIHTARICYEKGLYEDYNAFTNRAVAMWNNRITEAVAQRLIETTNPPPEAVTWHPWKITSGGIYNKHLARESMMESVWDKLTV